MDEADRRGFYLKFSFPGGSLPRVFVFTLLVSLSLKLSERVRQVARSFYFNFDTLY
jgi:hypothetical protein